MRWIVSGLFEFSKLKQNSTPPKSALLREYSLFLSSQKVAKEWPTQNSAKDPQMIWPPQTKAVQVTTSARSTDIAAEVVIVSVLISAPPYSIYD